MCPRGSHTYTVMAVPTNNITAIMLLCIREGEATISEIAPPSLRRRTRVCVVGRTCVRTRRHDDDDDDDGPSVSARQPAG